MTPSRWGEYRMSRKEAVRFGRIDLTSVYPENTHLVHVRKSKFVAGRLFDWFGINQTS